MLLDQNDDKAKVKPKIIVVNTHQMINDYHINVTQLYLILISPIHVTSTWIILRQRSIKMN